MTEGIDIHEAHSTMPPTAIYVINPNSSESVTEVIRDSVDGTAADDWPIECVTLAEGPGAIESHADFAAAVPLVEAFVGERSGDAAAFVVACFSDPGVVEARSVTDRPVVGIQEAAFGAARERGDRFGVVALVEASVERQKRSIEEAGLAAEWAGSRALGIGIADLVDRARVWPRLTEVGRLLTEVDRADVIVLGCAGMGPYRDDLQRELGVPVVEPCGAGVSLALSKLAESGRPTATRG